MFVVLAEEAEDRAEAVVVPNSLRGTVRLKLCESNEYLRSKRRSPPRFSLRSARAPLPSWQRRRRRPWKPPPTQRWRRCRRPWKPRSEPGSLP